ncbi:MAG: 50S ribosomal protein L29 [Saprospiraceae bacterium]|nr:50S ribosomal protein L29 [Saprospiraceae bacterium]
MAKQKFAPAELNDEQLLQELNSREAEYQQSKFDHAAKGIANPMELRDMRRNIARIHTEVRRRELANASPEELAARTKIRARRRQK